MNDFDIEFQRNILSNYVFAVDKAIENDEHFINAIDFEIRNIVKSVLLDNVDNSIMQKVSNILNERTEQDIIYTKNQIEVCKAIKLACIYLISESEKSIETSCITDFQENIEDKEMMERVNDILNYVGNKLSEK